MEPLLQIPSKSGSEERISKFILQYIDKTGNWNSTIDEIFNIYAYPENMKIDDNLPLLMAHLDTVLEPKSSDKVKLSFDQDGTTVVSKKDYFGFVDKCGIAIILWLMKYRKDLKFKVIFTAQEESSSDGYKNYRRYGRNGGAGIEYALTSHSDFFNVSWGIMIDRAEDKESDKGDRPSTKIREELSDIVYYYAGNNMSSPPFCKDIKKISIKLKTPMRLVKSDANADILNIRKKYPHISLVNLAAGGYNEHHKGDYLNAFEALRTLRVVESCLEKSEKLRKSAK
jgi:hypothetical protein